MLVWYLCSRLDSLECEHGFDYIQEQCKPHFQKLPAGYFGGKTFNSTGYMEFKWAVVNISIKKKKKAWECLIIETNMLSSSENWPYEEKRWRQMNSSAF